MNFELSGLCGEGGGEEVEMIVDWVVVEHHIVGWIMDGWIIFLYFSWIFSKTTRDGN